MNMTTYIGGGLALAVVALYFMWSLSAADVKAKKAEIEAARAQVVAAQAAVSQAKQTNADMMAALARTEAERARTAEVAAKYDRLARTRAAELNNALRRIASAPATDDGPVAPVLKRELDSLRSVAPPDPGPDGLDQVGSSPAAGVDAKHDLPAPAGAPGS